MPESQISSLAVIRKECLTNIYGEEVSQLLTGEVIPRLSISTSECLHRAYNRYLSIATQGGWFHSKVRELQGYSGIGGLAYLHNDSCTHEYKKITKDQAGQVVWVQTEGYTVLTSDWDAEIAAIQGLEDWCRKHPEQAGNVLEHNGKDVLEAIESQFFTLDPSNEGLGEGNGPEFFFCMLRTIGELMRFARFHKNISGMWVIYHTTLRYGS